MSKVIITIDNASSHKDIINAVRRSLKGDKALKVGTVEQVKDLTIRVKETPKTPKRNNLSHVREWAAAQGIALGKRGRISAEVLNQFNASH